MFIIIIAGIFSVYYAFKCLPCVSVWPGANGWVLGRTVTSNGKRAAHRRNCSDFSHCTRNETAFPVPFFRATGGTGRAVVSQGSQGIRGSNQEPWATARAPAGSRCCCLGRSRSVTRSLQVWQQKALCKACHSMLYHLIPLNSARRSQILLPFQISVWFSPPFLPFSVKVCPGYSPGRFLSILIVLECWETLGEFYRFQKGTGSFL